MAARFPLAVFRAPRSARPPAVLSALLAVACLTWAGTSARADDAAAELERLDRLLTQVESASPVRALQSKAATGAGREPATALGSLEATLRRRYQSHESRFDAAAAKGLPAKARARLVRRRRSAARNPVAQHVKHPCR